MTKNVWPSSEQHNNEQTLKNNSYCHQVLPVARFIMWQLSVALFYSWRFVMEIKKSTDNHIAILGEALVTWYTPSWAHCRLNHFQPRLSAHNTEKQQGEGCGGPSSEDPEEQRHGSNCCGHLEHIWMSQYVWLRCSIILISVKHNSH